VKIRWRGHSSFIIETEGKTIVTDPFNAEYGYPMIPVTADIVTVSHDHRDHNAVATIDGQPHVISGIGTEKVSGITVTGIDSFHDRNGGRERGHNTIFKILTEGLEVVHLGDLGQNLSARQVTEIGNVDILLLPVGGRYTIGAEEAFGIVSTLQPKIVIPMHFATPHLSFTLAPVEEFISHYDMVIKKPYLEVSSGNLGRDLRIILLEYL
jgi:L-ascorbate metabolism protein UlaG (beta-lactamase superfamily)